MDALKEMQPSDEPTMYRTRTALRMAAIFLGRVRWVRICLEALLWAYLADGRAARRLLRPPHPIERLSE